VKSPSTTGECTIIGGGLAGTEAALVLARAGVKVTLHEMRPATTTPAHNTHLLGELVCSNSLRSDSPTTAGGLLKEEMRRLGSPLLAVADATRVPAGSALAVDRHRFAARLTGEVEGEPNIALVRGECTAIDSSRTTLLCPGPLASPSLMAAVEKLVGRDRLFFFDAIAPIVDADSLDMSRLFYGSRYQKGGADYLNAPLDRATYMAFVETLGTAEQFVPHGFEADDPLPLFSGCQPIEAIASGGILSLAHGPLRPTGFFKETSLGRDLFALVQLRAENLAGTAYNLVGFQTRLRQAEQKRVFRLIPGLEQAEFLRFGSLHRNSYIDSPRLLNPDLSLKAAPDVFVAGQFAGAEGYMESAALGLMAAWFILARLNGPEAPVPPPETALGALHYHVTASMHEPLEPSNIHFGLFPPGQGRGKKARRAYMVQRAREAMEGYHHPPSA